MVLTAQEESLINVVRSLPPDQGQRFLEWVRDLIVRSQGRPIEYSDAWSDEDLEDIRRASADWLETQERDSP